MAPNTRSYSLSPCSISFSYRSAFCLGPSTSTMAGMRFCQSGRILICSRDSLMMRIQKT
ncbi:hypothetical protein HETIRDRAFT_166520 [Heterobasidion irregulare TC 32-1]|uniref:Uncharacterized protein n=1 Tax=Heterobasidion irregulare (strain TC 32-1) TaxID=747525 RepID=W4KMF8_HETIT|nr:uncharacterized protein HETIRDRAFT_166520 [Heterobasidion irregulare TC 32-1]ETW86997.1 hypothetical protein HETIRDRAFT_166520 [Heterobasidion irregulare TC 32-1]